MTGVDVPRASQELAEEEGGSRAGAEVTAVSELTIGARSGGTAARYMGHGFRESGDPVAGTGKLVPGRQVLGVGKLQEALAQ
ncbi:hypothetical protein NDU88_004145 [Pleurodeles waltl]|uniref:Uncharacterized protein n=1 Tax=Pleurodeles waltl TaxID=8319 RepID=A0AAV7VIZ5_PLEWA|nr:hypothetical protein NDU88_004145 [Pleurodeles waltl]